MQEGDQVWREVSGGYLVMFWYFGRLCKFCFVRLREIIVIEACWLLQAKSQFYFPTSAFLPVAARVTFKPSMALLSLAGGAPKQVHVIKVQIHFDILVQQSLTTLTITPKQQNSKNIETFRPDTDFSKTNLKWQHLSPFLKKESNYQHFMVCNLESFLQQFDF